MAALSKFNDRLYARSDIHHLIPIKILNASFAWIGTTLLPKTLIRSTRKGTPSDTLRRSDTVSLQCLRDLKGKQIDCGDSIGGEPDP